MKTLPWLAIALSTAVSLPLLTAESTSINQLGQAHLAVTDVSANPNWHVYRFQRDGIEYL